MKIGNGLRFGYYSNSLNFLDLLSFQTTLVIYAKINKMCCPTKENTCFFLSDRLFGCYIDGLIVLLKFSSSSAGISYTPIFVNFTIGHNPFLPLVWPPKRGRTQSVERVSRNLLPATFLCIGHTSKVWIFSKTIFQCFFFRYFPFHGSGCKSRIVFRRRSRSYSGGDKSLTHISDTSDLSDKDAEKYTPAHRGKPEWQTSYLSLFRLCPLRWLYTPAS